MHISQIIRAEAIKSLSTISSKKRLFQQVAELAALNYDLSEDAVVEALREREALGPTGVGHGVALPHARLEGLDSVVAVFVRLDKPLEFNSTDRQPVDLFFALLAPVEAGVEHLKALALVSRTLRDEDVRAKLRANESPATLHAILTEGPSSQAA